ncbi:MAG: hypothetical protein PHG98_06015 [Bacteroidales bacterium]|nr:hypothetical protein [Bacteroidales bacterium]
MKRILLVLLVISSNLFSQELPNRIIINKSEKIGSNSWSISYYDNVEYELRKEKNTYSLYRDDSIKHDIYYKKNESEKKLRLIKKVPIEQVSNLIGEIYNPNYDSLSFSILGIDTNYIKKNTRKYLKKVKVRTYYKKLSKEEIEYSKKELKNIGNYYSALKNYLYSLTYPYDNEPSSTIDLEYNDTIIKLERYGIIPWEFTNTTKKTFNINISKSLLKIFEDKIFVYDFSEDRDHLIEILLKNYVVEKINDDLKQISYKQFSKEIDELKKEFQILSIEEESGSSRYYDSDNQKFKIELKNSFMKDNVYLKCFLYNYNGKLYSRDSILKEYKDIIDRVQSIEFISDYLCNNPNSRLDIYYFNNDGINKDIIESFNGTSNGWKEYDKDISEGKEGYLNLRCGCNFRLDNEYLKGSIVFDLEDKDKLHSTWILLPNNTPVLYILDSDSIFNYSRKELGFDQEHSFIYPCKKFDRKGNIIN